jgi:hypothetical protein
MTSATGFDRADFERSLTDEARAWLEGALEEIAASPAAVRKHFPAAGRKVGRAVLPTPQANDLQTADPAAWTTEDAARSLMLIALGDSARDELWDLYRFGDADEQRAIVRSLGLLEDSALDQSTALDLVRDATRTNDPRLVRVALGPYGLAHLGDDEIAQVALKCVFCEVPLSCIEGLEGRATPQLARMLASFALERVAAGRTVPTDIWPFIDLYPPEDLLAAIEAEQESPVAERSDAARAALAGRGAFTGKIGAV